MACDDLLRYNIVFQVYRTPIQPWLDYAIDYDHGPRMQRKINFNVKLIAKHIAYFKQLSVKSLAQVELCTSTNIKLFFCQSCPLNLSLTL